MKNLTNILILGPSSFEKVFFACVYLVKFGAPEKWIRFMNPISKLKNYQRENTLGVTALAVRAPAEIAFIAVIWYQVNLPLG